MFLTQRRNWVSERKYRCRDKLYYQAESFIYSLVCRERLGYFLVQQNQIGALTEPVCIFALDPSFE